MANETLELLNRGIKEIIDEYPHVGEILEEYEIGCVPCTLGTCLMKDVVDIHNVAPEAEQKMMSRIVETVYPGSNIDIPLRQREEPTSNMQINYSPPMMTLVKEHVLIMRLVALIPAIIKDIDFESENGVKIILDSVDFIRSYADKFHHAKEEEILFKYFDPDLDVLKVMHQDHETGRAHVSQVLESVDRSDPKSAADNLNSYRVLLTEHIKKEDEILFPWMDRQLTDRQVGLLFHEFNETDARFKDAPDKYRKLIEALEKQYDL